MTTLVTGATGFVGINLVRNREVLRSNLTNSTEMYHVGGWRQGVPNALWLIAEGATPGMAVAGAVGILAGRLGLVHAAGSRRGVGKQRCHRPKR